MAYTLRLIESVLQTARSRTSGYQDDEEINRNIAMVESDLMEILVPLYSTNQKVQDLLAPFVVPFTTTSVISGVVTFPSDYVQIVDSMYNDLPIYKKNVNEVSLVVSSPIRKPNLEKGPYYCYFTGSRMNVLPASIPNIQMSYIKRPEAGKIAYSFVDDEEEDYATISVVTEISWPERAFNILYYLLLEKYGIENQSQLALEYSQLGINKEISKV